MKKTFLLLIFFLFFIFNSRGQNLVPNGDFEQYSGCPSYGGQIDSALFWMNPSTNLWTTGSPDYYNQCAIPGGVGVPYNLCGFQQAHSGVAYGGVYLYTSVSIDSVREYLEAPLTSILTANTCYHFEMFVNLANICRYTTDDIGVYFSDTAITGINNYYPLPFTPQINNTAGNAFDTSGWTPVSGNYTAAGGESFLIIGNFKDDTNTTVTVCNSNSANMLIYVYIDDVSLTPCTSIEEQNQNAEIKIYPNPVKDELLFSGLKFLVENNAAIKIFDVLGKEAQPETRNLEPETKINVSTLKSGIYFIEINNGKNILRKKFLKE